MPEDVTLVVKEHESQVSSLYPGERGRSSSFYSLVQTLPNTEMISGALKSSGQIRRSVCVFTITGSIGIETALAGVPCVYFGNPWWSQMPNTHYFDPSLSFEHMVASSPVEPGEVKDFLISRLRYQAIPGFGTPGGRRFWSSQVELDSSFSLSYVRAVVHVVEIFLSRKGLWEGTS